MDSLLSKGLVESYGKPMRFKAVSANDVISVLSRGFDENIRYLKMELPKIEAEEVDIIRVYRETSSF